MASRQQEKEARRKARLEQEAAERKAAARSKRLQLVLGGILAVGIVVGIVVAIAAGGSSGSSGSDGPRTASTTSDVKLPDQQTSDLTAAAKTAGCTVKTEKDEGRQHKDKTFTAADYGTNPPTSGTHYPSPAQDGIYDAGNSPALGESTHSLEHGRIDVQYKPGTSDKLVKQLEAFVGENGGYHMLLFENTTKMKPQLAATAWDQMLQCPTPNDKTWDALRTFRDRYLDKGPETVP
jgi:Protein of unknown function (DUF3105)